MKNRKKQYVEVPIAYDIETTSFYSEGEKQAIIYTHTFSDDGEVTILRTWDECYGYLSELMGKYNASPATPIVIYVHNLAYEFGFIKDYFSWDNVFAVGSTHRIARAVTKSGIEFRCSYILTNTSLKYVGEEVGITKMIGDLDYDLFRHTETPLTDEEIGYIENDVQIIVELIRSRMEKDGGLGGIPMTKTGYVRRSVSRIAYSIDPNFSDKIMPLTMNMSVYAYARAAFQGGYVHANAKYTGKVVENVTSYDLSSSYPASIIKGIYPMSKFAPINDPDLDTLLSLKDTTFLTDITLHNIDSKYPFPPISESKTKELKKEIIDNGRVFSASVCRVIVTNVDLKTILRCYDVESISVNNILVATSEHIPYPIGSAILKFYGDKTTLKGVEGKEEEYKLGKENTNSIYGMIATDPVRQQHKFDEETNTLINEFMNIQEQLDDHNTKYGRILYYPWAAWVTAYSRSTLLNTMYDLIDAGVEVLYCDTDSIKFIASDKAEAIIEQANDKIKLEMMDYFDEYEEYYQGDMEKIMNEVAPKTIKGEPKFLGLFDHDGEYKTFKTLGAKRYAVTIDADGAERFLITTSGLSKFAGDHKKDGEWVSGYVTEHGGMDFYKDGMTIPKEHSGRMTHTYSNDVVKFHATDYLGNTTEINQSSFVHLEATDFTLSIAPQYSEFFTTMQ